MVRVRLEPSARLRWQAGRPEYDTSDSDTAFDDVELPDYPRADDYIAWPSSGRAVRVVRIAWFVGQDVPTVVVE
jgi:hypothetical protein